MKVSLRSLVISTAAAAIAIVTIVPAASAHPLVTEGLDGASKHAVQGAGVGSLRVAGSANPCADSAYRLLGGRWARALEWRFRSSSTPAGLNKAVLLNVLKRSFENIVDARNDCGRPDKVSAEAVYKGETNRRPGISQRAHCTGNDGVNVVSFGRLPQGILAVTCAYFFASFIIAADIQINTRYPWVVSAAKCAGQELLEPTVTHEVGHAFGLGHVGERRHPLLTMSTRSDGACSDEASTLGLGDMLGLEELY